MGDDCVKEMVGLNLRADALGELRSADFLGSRHTCGCGRIHGVSLEKVIIGNGAIRSLPQLLQESGCNKVFLLADSHTYRAAGGAVQAALSGSCKIEALIFQRDHDLVPDEKALGEIFLRYPADTEIIVAVGTGVLNDLAKYASHKLHVPCLIVATAPSMDGFASDGAALIVDNVKVSYPSANVKAIIGDVDVLKQAPAKMIAAGLGDMLGKFSALRDWQLGALIEDEYHCPAVAAMVEKSVLRCIGDIGALCRREDAAVANLMEGLVLTGIAMSFAGSSRPASGSEHHLSHFWEMMFLLDGKAAVLHGTKVGIASAVISRLSAKLSAETIDWDACERRAAAFRFDDWKAKIQDVYKEAAPGILKLAAASNRQSTAERLQRLARIRKHWPEIAELLRGGPSPASIGEWLRSAGACVHPSEAGISRQELYQGVLHAKEIRSRYSVLQLLDDLGLLEEYAGAMRDGYA